MSGRKGGRRRWLDVLLMLGVLLILGGARPGFADKNLLHNGDFRVGSGTSVDGWRNDAWILTPGTTDYLWIPPHGDQPGEVELFTRRDNDARWVQPLSLGPGWYYMSVDVRTVKALPFFTGASISVLEDGIISADLRGDNDWRRVGLYLKIGPHGSDVDMALRLGGYMNLTRGQAFFRDASVVRIAAPPPGTQYVFDLDAIRKQETSGPIGRPWTLAATALVLLLLAVGGWRLMTVPQVVTAATPAPRRSKAGRHGRR